MSTCTQFASSNKVALPRNVGIFYVRKLLGHPYNCKDKVNKIPFALKTLSII
jgi:hypothetical protein